MNDTAPAARGDIAIIGMAGRFPGARDIEAFWANLVAGVESIRRLDDEALRAAGVSAADLDDPAYVKACPVLDDVDCFDAAFFGISPRDASVMDPAHRLFLEVAWQALEHAGNTGLPEEGRVGVWAASGAPLYWMNHVRGHRELMASMGEFLVRHTGNDMNFLATRTSYELDLRGPSINVQTACSSALVALHLARQSLLAGECDMALVGGATVLLPQGQGYHFKEGEILSPDGHCRPFDHRSAGTVFGSGAGCLVLKRLDDALDQGDTVWAVVKGSAVNNDGALKVGYLAPGVEGQAAAVREALRQAGASARQLRYVEAHGTGTRVGDPIELTALQQAFGEQTEARGFCALGSVKSNIGHLGEAAAAASLIKVALALRHRVLPPTLGFERPNPGFPMAESAFFVNTQPLAWPQGEPLLAGITALGAGGTNCHVVLAEPPPPLAGEGGRGRELLVLSAHSRPALERMAERLAAQLEAQPQADLADVAYTLALGRRTLPERRAVVAASAAEAAAVLRDAAAARSTTLTAAAAPRVVFSFPGGGAQYARMGLGLYAAEPAYRQALDECLALLDEGIAPGVRPLLFAPEHEAEAATRALQRPSNALPALFAVEYALAVLLQSLGLAPDAFIGHSMGEYVAACLAGVFRLADGLRLVALRGRLFETTRAGGMVGVNLPESVARARLTPGLSIAAVNAEDLCVVSGAAEEVAAFSQALGPEVDWTPVRINVAAHSALLEPILAEFGAFCRTIALAPPKARVVSNLSGTWLTAAQATSPAYWVDHLRHTVRFADGVRTLCAEGPAVFVEVGPGRTLTTLVAAQRAAGVQAVNTMRHPQEAADDASQLLQALGRAWAAGAAVDWTALYDGQLRNRVPLPGYPFERTRFWLEPAAAPAALAEGPQRHAQMDDWFATPVWQPAPRLPAPAPAGPWLLAGADADRLEALRRRLQARLPEARIAVVQEAPRARRSAPARHEMPLASADAWRSLLSLLRNEGTAPAQVLLLGSRRAPDVEASFFVPAHLAQAAADTLDGAVLTFVTWGAQALAGEAPDPVARLPWGVAAVLRREMPDFPARAIDIDPGAPDALDRLVAELAGGDAAPQIALRGSTRWRPAVQPVSLPPPPAEPGWLADGDVVLVTGGLGGIGGVLARHLAAQRRVALALLSREGLPPRAEWARALADTRADAGLQRRVRQVQALEAGGARVLVVRGDVADAASLNAALAQVRSELGLVNVVIHAAGVMHDAPLQTQTDEAMRRVLAPKVQGTLNLDRLITEDLKAFIVMSSVASLLGLPGQADYTAANAFLDAFAQARSQRRPGRTLALNWNAWKGVGMVAAGTPPPMPPGRTAHPWLQACESGPAGARFVTDFAVATHWLLSEHRIAGGEALVPGTGLLELVRAAFAEATRLRNGSLPERKQVELVDVSFLRPFQVGPRQVRQMEIHVDWRYASAAVRIRSAGEGELHTAAEARWVDAGEPGAPLPALAGARLQPTRNGFLDQDFVDFGPRWRNLREVRLGEGQAVLQLALDPAFGADLPALACHPALLDMATGGAQALIPGFEPAADFLVPLGYERVRVLAPLAAQIASHVRLRPGSTRETASFDVRIFDATGRLLMDIEGFTMRRVERQAPLAAEPAQTAPGGSGAALQAVLRDAIAPEEGVLAFDRALAQDALVQVVASSVDVPAWQRRLDEDARRLGGEAAGAPRFERPGLGPLVPPRSALEHQLAELWQDLLGLAEVGITDDFFDLGGNSLVAVRLARRVEQVTGLRCALSQVFQHPRIEALAEALGGQAATGEGGASARLVLAQGAGAARLHFVCGQHVYRDIARALAPQFTSSAIYLPLEEELFDGRAGAHDGVTVENFARHYREAIVAQDPAGPYWLAGLSFGGIVAYEVAQQLQAEGREVAGVVVFDSILPSSLRRDWPRWALEKLQREGLGLGAALINKAVSSLARRVRGTPQGEAGREQALEQTRARFYLAAATAYQPPRAAFPVVLVRASERMVMDSDIANPTYGWDRLCERLQVLDAEGDHVGIIDAARAPRLAPRLLQALGRPPAAPPPAAAARAAAPRPATTPSSPA